MTKLERAFVYLFALLYVGSGINHFRDPDLYVRMMPPYLPLPRELVLLSGVVEIVLGLAALHPRWRARAAWAVILMLLAFMPVHVHMALHPELYPDLPAAGLWVRIPFQLVFIGWAYGLAKRPTKTLVAAN
jgi:uncharacterized membrane protein